MAEESYATPIDVRELGLTLPKAISPSQKSFFVVGLHKAGSTLLTSLFSRLALGYRYVPYNLHQAIYDRSLLNQDVSISPEDFFEPFGYAFIGFRGWSRGHGLPSWSKHRVVQLVRDPRDVLVSMYFSISMSHAAPRSTLQREAFDKSRRVARELDIDGFVLKCADSVYQEYADTILMLQPAAPKIWRYEDVIFNKVLWVRDMLRFLGMEPPPGDVLSEIIRPFDVFPDDENPEKHIRQVKPGDHKAKLASATIERLSERFAPVLKMYGYT